MKRTVTCVAQVVATLLLGALYVFFVSSEPMCLNTSDCSIGDKILAFMADLICLGMIILIWTTQPIHRAKENS